MNAFTDWIKRQADVLTAVAAVTGIMWGGLTFIAMPWFNQFIDERIEPALKPVTARIDNNSALDADTNRDVEKVKTDILIINETLKHVDKQMDRMEKKAEERDARMENKLDKLTEGLLPMRHGLNDEPMRPPQ